MKSLPFKYKGFIPSEKFGAYMFTHNVKLLSRVRAHHYLGAEIYNTFDNIFTNVVQSMAEHDYDYLKSIMEKRLYTSTYDALEDIKSKNYKLDYIPGTPVTREDEAGEGDSDAETLERRKHPISGDRVGALGDKRMNTFFESPFSFTYNRDDIQIHLQALGAFGVDIDRSLNNGKYTVLGSPLVSKRFYFNPNSWKDLYYKQILILNVYYFTNRKLVLYDNELNVVEGSVRPKECFDHKFRFETYVDKIDWVLTDINESLNGNQYTEELRKKVQEKEELKVATEKKKKRRRRR